MLIDTHIHLDLYKNINIDELIDRALQKDVRTLIDVGINISSSRLAIEFAKKYPNVYAVVGVHPHEAKSVDKKLLEELKVLAHEPKVVAIGEIGLDYYRDLSPRDVQRRAFLLQLDLAKELGLPVVVHNRDAHEDVMEILEKADLPSKKVLIHCFSGNTAFLDKVMEKGHYISIGGPVTFKNATKTVEAIKRVSLDKLILETDGPFLAPHPHRGKLNESALLPLVAQKIAEVRGTSFANIAMTTSNNALEFFGIEI